MKLFIKDYPISIFASGKQQTLPLEYKRLGVCKLRRNVITLHRCIYARKTLIINTEVTLHLQYITIVLVGRPVPVLCKDMLENVSDTSAPRLNAH